MNRNRQTINPVTAEPDPTHPAYLHMLVGEAAAKGTIIVLTSEPETLTLCLIAGTWHSLETIGEEMTHLEWTHSPEKDKKPYKEPIPRHQPGTGHDCLVIQTHGGIETELTVAQTAELITKLEILLNKKKASLIEIPQSIVPPNFKAQ